MSHASSLVLEEKWGEWISGTTADGRNLPPSERESS